MQWQIWVRWPSKHRYRSQYHHPRVKNEDFMPVLLFSRNGFPILRHKCVICDQEGVNISWDVIRSQFNVLLIKIKSKILPVTSFCYMWIVSSERKAAILKNRPWRAWMTSYHFALLWTWKLRKFHYRLNQFHNFFMISTLFEKIPPCEANY